VSLAWLVVALALCAVTLLRPRVALLALLAAFPFFLHKSASPWELRLLLLVTAFEVAYLARVPRRWFAFVATLRRDPLMFLVALYVAASALSLSSLPLYTLVAPHLRVFAIVPFDHWPYELTQLLTLDERAGEYSILSVLLTAQAFVFALIVRRELLRAPRLFVHAAWALTAGVAVATVAGLVEFYGLTSLVWLRGPGAANFLQDVPMRLQSVTGNPGWYAEYVVLTLPFAASLLLPGRAWRWRAGVLAFHLVLVQAAMFLSFQRGGWIASWVVLACLWVALAWQPSRAAGGRVRALVARFVPAAMPVALCLLVLAGLLYGSMRLGLHPAGTAAVGMYTDRVEGIARSSDRVPYMRAGFGIGILHPILGAGSESFALRYIEYYLTSNGPYAVDPVHVVTPTSAHNVYVQTFAGKGAVGLVLLLAVCGTGLWLIARRSAASASAGRETVVGLVMAGIALVGFLVYGVVQEVFYVHVLQLLVFFLLGSIAAITDGTLQWPPALQRRLVAVLALCFVLHLGYEHVYPGPSRLIRAFEPQGIFAGDEGPAGDQFRWSADRVVFPIPPGSSSFDLSVRSAAPAGQTVTVIVCGVEGGAYAVDDREWHRLRFLLPRSDLQQQKPTVEIDVAPPMPPGADGRARGVMVRQWDFR